MVPEDFFDKGAVVAVIGGRFLPVDKFAVTVDVDTQNIGFASSMNATTVTTSKEYTVEFTTKRDPMVDPSIVTTGYLYNESHKIVLDNVIGMSHGIVSEAWDQEHEVELLVDSFEIVER